MKNRRSFLTGAAALGAAAVTARTAQAEVRFPVKPGSYAAGGATGVPGSVFSGQVNRSEHTLYDCEVDGDLPDDLNGAFYRVGPDAQYPKPDESRVRHRLRWRGPRPACSASRTAMWTT